MKKILKIFLKILLLLIIPLTFIFLIVREIQKKKKVEYKTVTIQVGNIEKKVIVTGKILPQKEITIKPQGISGIIEKLYVKEGQIIRKGALIAKLSVIPDEASLNAARSRVNSARLSYTEKNREYQRNKSLFDKKIISRLEYENSETAFFTVREELSAARNNLQIIQTGAKAGSKTANTLIKSTISGMILDIPVEEGNSVIASNNFNDGTTIAFIANMSKLIFEGKVDETEVARLKKGMEIDIIIGALNEKTFKAEIEFISPKGTEEQGVVRFDIVARLLLDKGESIRAGYSANANIVVDRKDSINIIKEAYINFKEDSAFVEVLETEKPQKFKEKYIKTGLSDGINIEVVSGITASDKIKTTEIKKKKKSQKRTKTKNNQSPENQNDMRIIWYIIFCLFSANTLIAQNKKWSLQNCIDYAFQHNIVLKQKSLQTKKLKSTLKQSKLDRLPNLNASTTYRSSYGRSLGLDNTYTNVDNQTTNFRINTSFEIFDGLQKRNTIKKTKLDLLAQLEEYEKVKEDIILQIASYYLEILFSIDRLTIAQEQIDITSQQIERTKTLIQAGKLPHSDIYNLNSQLAAEQDRKSTRLNSSH